MKYTYTGKSLKELLEEFGTGSSGFYPQNWYEKEEFFTKKPEAGEYEIDFETGLTHLTYTKQLAKLPSGYTPIHPAILAEAILTHFKNTGNRLLASTYSRTSVLDSDGNRVLVGNFDSDGLLVYLFWDDDRDGYIGLSAARKLSSNTGSLEPIETLSLESRIQSLEQDMEKIKKFLII